MGTIQKGEELCSGIRALIKEQTQTLPLPSTAGLGLDFQQSNLVLCSLVALTPNTHTELSIILTHFTFLSTNPSPPFQHLPILGSFLSLQVTPFNAPASLGRA